MPTPVPANPAKLPRAGELGLNASVRHTPKFSGRTCYEIRIRERKGPSRGIFQTGEPHEQNPCASSFEERTPEETSRQEDCARKAGWNLARKIYKLNAEDKATFWSPVDKKAPGLVSRNRENRMFVVHSGPSMHMLSKRDLSSDKMDILRKSKKPCNGTDRDWGSANKRGSTRFLFTILICS